MSSCRCLIDVLMEFIVLVYDKLETVVASGVISNDGDLTADAAERDSDTIGTLLSVGMTFLESGGKELTGELLGRDSVTTLDQGFDVLGRLDV